MPRESEIISRVRSRARVTGEISVGIGDDAAVIKGTGGKDLIACCDLMVEGVHFRKEWATPRLIGRKALAVNLSDVAAMGGIAKFAMMSIAVPANCPSQFMDELFGGMFDLADSCGVSIIGGDTSSSCDSLFLDVVAIGECDSGRAVTRGGAKPGDRIYVSGSLGASALGLSMLEGGFRLDDSASRSDAKRQAVLKHLAPEPQLKLGRALGEAALATAMIDISDGLSTDLWHILDESTCGAIIHANAIPIAESVRSIASGNSEIDPLRLALNGGEEYELLFTASPGNHHRVEKLSGELGVPISDIGEIVAERRLQLERNGRFENLAPSGFEHII